MEKKSGSSHSDEQAPTSNSDSELGRHPEPLLVSPVVDSIQHSSNSPDPKLLSSTSQSSPTSTMVPSASSPEVPHRRPVNYSEPSATLSHKERKASSPSSNGTPTRPGLERFRSSVRKVIHLTRGSSALSLGGAGAEPGIDPRRSNAFLSYGHIHQHSTIEIVDYSSVRTDFRRMHNKEFVEVMNEVQSSPREPWVKVRWINIGGISWDVMSAVSLAYNLHPLALEDVLHQRQKARSKADYYPQHLFIRLLRHTLAPEDEEDLYASFESDGFTTLPRSSSPTDFRTGEGEKREASRIDRDTTLVGADLNMKSKGWNSHHGPSEKENDIELGRVATRGLSMASGSSKRHRRFAENQLIQQLKGERVNVDVKPFCVFLLRDDTVISINRSPDLQFTTPISARLQQRDTGLRATADASLLVQSLLDLVVDQAMEVVDEYQRKILKLEHDVLLKPGLKSVRYLHTMSGDLTLHKRTLEPIKTLVYGLRRYDLDRCAALIESQGNGVTPAKVKGFMSHKSKIYLADVYDHMEYIISSLDMFTTTTENLINYTFNMASYEMNNVMRRLTLATIIFLPLTLLTGYFGMNFQIPWAVNNHSDLYFWEIALPLMAVLIPIFMWGDIRQGIHYLRRRWIERKFRKIVRQSQGLAAGSRS